MPQFKRYNKFPSSYNRRPMGSHLMRSYKSVSKYATAKNAGRALDLALKTAKLLNVEYKLHTVTVASTAVTDAGTITPLSLLVQGDTDITRNGNQVKWTSYYLHYRWRIHASAANTAVRLMIVHDKQTNQAQFALADILQSAAAQLNIFSPYNIDNVSRFNVLYDRVHSLVDVGDSAQVIRKLIKPLQLKIRYDANVGDVTDLTQDSLSLVLIGSEATNDPSITFFYRGRFIDN